jgi:hypothetical protein
MLFPSYALEVAVVAGLLILVWRVWRYERRCVLIGPLCDTPSEMDVHIDDPNEQLHRMVAIIAATVAFKGTPTDMENFLSVADECLQYIRGDGARMPRPDELSKGFIPR